ncbi:hypothetical protein AB0N24_04285 [Arthrobacter sp. NPDC093128]|uniref:hypothetical protein n=1 Tax=Arthrobacter sp. NPDC093128 TaxID=3154979 RepID=UPI00343911CA
MEQKLCKKCSSELPEDHKGARCEECTAARIRRIKKVGLVGGAALFAAVAVFSIARTESDEDSENDENTENNELSRSDSSRAAEMGISLTDYLILSEGIEDGKLSISWANYNLDAIKDGLLSAREVVNSGSPDDDD